MLGVVLILAALLLLIPAFLFGGAIGSAVMGQLLTWHGERSHEGSPLVECNE